MNQIKGLKKSSKKTPTINKNKNHKNQENKTKNKINSKEIVLNAP